MKNIEINYHGELNNIEAESVVVYQVMPGIYQIALLDEVGNDIILFSSNQSSIFKNEHGEISNNYQAGFGIYCNPKNFTMNYSGTTENLLEDYELISNVNVVTNL